MQDIHISFSSRLVLYPIFYFAYEISLNTYVDHVCSELVACPNVRCDPEQPTGPECDMLDFCKNYIYYSHKSGKCMINYWKAARLGPYTVKTKVCIAHLIAITP